MTGVEEAYCYLLGQIGQPIDAPAVIDLKLRLAPGVGLPEVQVRAGEVARQHLAGLGSLWRDVVNGSLTLF